MLHAASAVTCTCFINTSSFILFYFIFLFFKLYSWSGAGARGAKDTSPPRSRAVPAAAEAADSSVQLPSPAE